MNNLDWHGTQETLKNKTWLWPGILEKSLKINCRMQVWLVIRIAVVPSSNSIYHSDMSNITIYDNHMVASAPEVLNHIYFIMIDTKKCRMHCTSINSVGHVSKVSFLLTTMSIRRISEECWCPTHVGHGVATVFSVTVFHSVQPEYPCYLPLVTSHTELNVEPQLAFTIFS